MDSRENWSDIEVYEEVFGSEADALMHFGKAHDENPPGRGSGRYAYGSGDRPNQRDWSLDARIKKFKAANPGMSEVDVAKAFGYFETDYRGNILYFDPTGKRYMKKEDGGEPKGSTGKLRAAVTQAYNYDVQKKIARARELEDAVDPETGKKLYSRREIAELMTKEGYDVANESSVRSLLNGKRSPRFSKMLDAEDLLKKYADEGKFISLGPHASNILGLTESSFDTVRDMLRNDGYIIDKISVPQGGTRPGQKTTYLVLCPPGSTFGDAKKNLFSVRELDDIESTPLSTFQSMTDRDGNSPYRSIDLSRIDIRYAEQEGTLKDGTVEIRAIRNPDGTITPACPELSLGNAKYGQVRIAVSEDGEDKYYIKGMAFYNPDLPEGTDILVNSNKSIDGGPAKALKPLKPDKATGELTESMFGSNVWQSHYIDADGKEHQSCINWVGTGPNDARKEGAWADWGRNLPTQLLKHQDLDIVKQQLDMTYDQYKSQFDEINSLTNNTIRKQLLTDFGESCDAKAVDLKAHKFPGQSVNVLLPVPELKDNEIYAPNYKPGQMLAVVRFPYTGPWESPLVKNVAYTERGEKYAEFMRGAEDAVGLNRNVAQILSGADNDGDTVTVIPITREDGTKIQGTKVKTINDDPLYKAVANEMKGFDPNDYYTPDTSKHMAEKDKSRNMGIVANLMSDMENAGCEDPKKLGNLTKFNMIVIDAPKHELDWKAAMKDLGIEDLKKEYQPSNDPDHPNRHGASSLFSRAKSIERVDARSMRRDKIDPETGEYILETLPDNKLYRPEMVKVKIPAPEGYKWTDENGNKHSSKWLRDSKGDYLYETDPDTGRLIKVPDPSGKMVKRQETTTKMAEAKNAEELMSVFRTPVEQVYADFANRMKALGNEARKTITQIPTEKVDPEARREYAAERESLKEKLERAKANSMRERQAQILYNQIVKAKTEGVYDLSGEELKKIKGNAIKTAREMTGAHKDRVKFNEREWEAIQKHAISESDLNELLKNSDPEHYTALAMPKTSGVSNATAKYIQDLLHAGYSKNEIASDFHYSIDTINKVAKRTDLQPAEIN